MFGEEMLRMNVFLTCMSVRQYDVLSTASFNDLLRLS